MPTIIQLKEITKKKQNNPHLQETQLQVGKYTHKQLPYSVPHIA